MAAVTDGIESAGVPVDLSEPFKDFTVTLTPPEALVETREQICGTLLTSDEVIADVSMPSASDPPFPAKVPSQALPGDACEPTLKVMVESTEALTVT
jgi:hypothetical protein